MLQTHLFLAITPANMAGGFKSCIRNSPGPNYPQWERAKSHPYTLFISDPQNPSCSLLGPGAGLPPEPHETVCGYTVCRAATSQKLKYKIMLLKGGNECNVFPIWTHRKQGQGLWLHCLLGSGCPQCSTGPPFHSEFYTLGHFVWGCLKVLILVSVPS